MAQIKKTEFQRLIKNRDFRDLFISDLGWNRYKGLSNLPAIIVDDREYNIEAIAERSGFQILTCEADELPTQSLAKKIDSKLRNQAADYICIYSEKGSSKDLWVVPVRTNEKRDLVLVDYEDGKVDFLFSKIEGFAFDFDEETNIVDLRSKVQGAFAVNSEKITKDFYTGFRKEHKAFADFITGIDDHILTKDNKNKQWYTSVMLNRMMFCYFIQKKGFLAFDTSYLRNKLDWVRENEGENRFYNFYKSFLRRLFHAGLNSPARDLNFIDTFGKIPYLNGGMFEEHQIEKEYPDINIPDEAFIRLFDFFDTWRWHLDTRITASGKDINPDVLGYIFEQYINDRASMGAYYTKEDITEYISRSCILPFLFDKVKDSTNDSYKDFEPDGFVWQTLKNSGDKYIFDAVKKGHQHFTNIPENIKRGIITPEMKKEYSETPIGELPDNHILISELRKDWNKPTPEFWGLPTEIWRETIERLQRCEEILNKIRNGDITSINDFITYNLDIRNFALDLINSGDSKFVKHFYEALQGVSILDPTCGSGAFLFAAMNILEPLYEACIFRMQEFNKTHPNLFKKELQEINGKYRSNIQYFIFKSIILRNLYGVDIMVEATEIAKLRLFLKMVAVVDVDRKADNLGLDPLPDIDFNIRCGNTLVGYATQKQLDEDLAVAKDIMEELANQEFKEKIDEELIKVADADRLFKKIQMEEDENIEAFKSSKYELKSRLSELNDSLNHRLYLASGSPHPYNEWLSSHQPFNWLAEFYQIMQDNGGFDIIIGNPPYVEYNKKDKGTGKRICEKYKVVNYETINCANLYAYVIERSCIISKNRNNIGFIVPLSIVSNNNMLDLRSYLTKRCTSWYSHYEVRPAKLFEGAEQRLTIFFIRNTDLNQIFSTSIQRWNNEHRNFLFKKLHYANSFNDSTIWRTSSDIESGVYKKFNLHKSSSLMLRSNGHKVYYRTAGVRYWIIFLNNGFGTDSLSNKFAYFENKETATFYMAAFNSNLFWWYYALNFDMFNLKDYMIFNFKLNYINDNRLSQIATQLELDLENKKVHQEINSKTRGLVTTSYYQKKRSKQIIDEIDKVLAQHYGFTEEELDFIINYDIKYRMGDELNSEE